MIELTEQQVVALANSEAGLPRLVNPLTNEMYVLVREEDYERFQNADYDDSPWTREELQSLAWAVGADGDRDNEDEPDVVAERS